MASSSIYIRESWSIRIKYLNSKYYMTISTLFPHVTVCNDANWSRRLLKWCYIMNGCSRIASFCLLRREENSFSFLCGVRKRKKDLFVADSGEFRRWDLVEFPASRQGPPGQERGRLSSEPSCLGTRHPNFAQHVLQRLHELQRWDLLLECWAIHNAPGHHGCRLLRLVRPTEPNLTTTNLILFSANLIDPLLT